MNLLMTSSEGGSAGGGSGALSLQTPPIIDQVSDTVDIKELTLEEKERLDAIDMTFKETDTPSSIASDNDVDENGSCNKDGHGWECIHLACAFGASSRSSRASPRGSRASHSAAESSSCMLMECTCCSPASPS